MALEVTITVPCPVPDLEEFLDEVLKACLQVEGIGEMQVSGCVVDDQAIRALNLRHRGVDSATDVLSFPSISYPPGKTARDVQKRLRREGCFLGDFAISLEHAQRQAEAYGHSVRREIGYLTAHSIFHLCGYDHMNEADKALMRSREEAAMALVNLSR